MGNWPWILIVESDKKDAYDVVKFYNSPEVKGDLQNSSVSVMRNQIESENSYLSGVLMLY